MRYSKDESTILAGVLPPQQTVTIKIINMDDDSIVPVSNDACIESTNVPGVYFWDTNNITQDFISQTNLLYVMQTANGEKFYGKFVKGGIVDDIYQSVITVNNNVNTMLDVEQGTWEIKDKQMIFYDRNNTEFMRFNLFDKNGQPTDTAVFKRERIK